MTDTPLPAKKPPPLSPHLQVYKPQLASSVLSIFHRITGVGLSLGAIVLVAWLAAAVLGPVQYDFFMSLLRSYCGIAIMMLISLALFYHLCAGIRHLVFDMGYGFSLPAAHRSAWAVIVASLTLTTLLWLYIGGWL